MMKNEIQYLLNTGSCSNHKFVCPQGPCGDSEGCDRFIPIFGGAHNRFNKYEECTLVYDPETLVAYISKRGVPTGVEITNRKYWQPMNVSGYADDNIIIFSDRNQAGQLTPYTLETAVPCVEISGRKNGTIISFYSTTNIPHWEIWQYQNSDTCHWEELQYWKLVTNIYNKFVGWYNNLDELESIPVNDRVGKYALIGNTLIDAHIYKGTRYGWIDTGLNIYQKFFDDVCQEGTVTLTEEQKKFFCNLIGALFKDDLVLELTRIFKNYHDYPDLEQVLRDLFADLFKWLLEHLDLYPDVKNIFELYLKKIIEKYANNEVTNFEVISHIQGIGDFDMKYPTSIYSDCSKMITYNDTTGRKNESILEVPEYFTDNLDLKFTAGVWKGITNNGEEYCLCSTTPIEDMRQASTCCGADPWGFLRFNIPTYPRGMQVIVDDNAPIPYTDNFAVFCDGGSHVIEFIEALTYTVTFHYYNAPETGSYVGSEQTYILSINAGETASSYIPPTAYKGHNFVGWATNYKIYNTQGLNPYTASDAIHSYNVVGKSNTTPQYFDFATPINEDIDLYAWYNIPITLYWEDDLGQGSLTKYVNYNDYIINTPSLQKAGYTIAGWKYNNHLYPESIGPIVIDGTAIAEFTQIPTYLVTFNSDGGTEVPSQTIALNGVATRPQDPTKAGYLFNNWYRGQNIYDFNTPVTANITLKAVWTSNTLEVSPVKIIVPASGDSQSLTIDSSILDGTIVKNGSVEIDTNVFNAGTTEVQVSAPENTTEEEKILGTIIITDSAKKSKSVEVVQAAAAVQHLSIDPAELILNADGTPRTIQITSTLLSGDITTSDSDIYIDKTEFSPGVTTVKVWADRNTNQTVHRWSIIATDSAGNREVCFVEQESPEVENYTLRLTNITPNEVTAKVTYYKKLDNVNDTPILRTKTIILSPDSNTEITSYPQERQEKIYASYWSDVTDQSIDFYWNKDDLLGTVSIEDLDTHEFAGETIGYPVKVEVPALIEKSDYITHYCGEHLGYFYVRIENAN